MALVHLVHKLTVEGILFFVVEVSHVTVYSLMNHFFCAFVKIHDNTYTSRLQRKNVVTSEFNKVRFCRHECGNCLF